MPVTALNTVVLPAPLGPMIEKISPSSTRRFSPLTAVTPPPAHALADVVGYIAVGRGKDRDRVIDTAAQIIEPWCAGRGWRLSKLVHDIEPASGRIFDRPGLAYALAEDGARRVAGLVHARLGDVTRAVT